MIGRQLLISVSLFALLASSLAGNLAAQESPDCEEGFRLVAHYMGESCVPEAPERVVVLDTGELDGMIALGLTPVGMVEPFAGAGAPAYLAEQVQDVEIVGTIAEPNLEAILALQPDLILSSALRHEAIYEQLAEIAPTVFAETVGVVWKDNFMLLAEALNRTEDAEAVMERYNERLETLAEAIGDPADIEVSIVRFVPGQNRVMQRGNFIGTILDDAGFSRPDAQNSEEFMVEVDKEGIQLMDGDVIFISTYGDPAETAQASFLEDPLWQTLSAVRDGNVHSVSDDTWMLAIGPSGANLVIDDLFAFFAPDYIEAEASPEATPAATEEAAD